MQVQDPVCGITCDEKDVVAETVREGRTYKFCTPACYAMFSNDPEEYAGQRKSAEWPGESAPKQ